MGTSSAVEADLSSMVCYIMYDNSQRGYQVMGSISLRLTEGLEQRLAEEVRIERKSRSELLREALREFLHRRERERFMAAMVAEARQAYGDPEIRREAMELAEEFLPLDNEALDIAERRHPGESWPEESGDNWWK